MIQLHWSVLASIIGGLFWIIVLILILKSGGGDFDFGTPLLGCGWILIGIILLLIVGGIYWW